jgi:hypothetical protein
MKNVRTQLLSTCPSEKQFAVSDKIWNEVYVGCSEEVWNVNFVDHVRYTFDAHFIRRLDKLNNARKRNRRRRTLSNTGI